MSTAKAAKTVGLIGWPVEHSASPVMFNAAFEALGLNWRYEAFPVPPEKLERTLRDLHARGVLGFNVTVPHKQAILPHLDSILPEARAVGAVNTVTALADPTPIWQGTNTDILGFQRDLLIHLPDPRPGMLALILGAGGAAHAATYVLARLGFQIMIVSRTPGRGLELIRSIQSGLRLGDAEHPIESTQWRMQIRTMTPDRLAELKTPIDLIVNCTPVGMWPNTEASPWPDGVPFPPTAFVYDMVYRPEQTLLVRQAQATGLNAVSGLGMLVQQGAAAFQRWTGTEAPIALMLDAARQVLAQ